MAAQPGLYRAAQGEGPQYNSHHQPDSCKGVPDENLPPQRGTNFRLLRASVVN